MTGMYLAPLEGVRLFFIELNVGSNNAGESGYPNMRVALIIGPGNVFSWVRRAEIFTRSMSASETIPNTK
jgi:hypothetical protein